jgi:hypothetical protein
MSAVDPVTAEVIRAAVATAANELATRALRAEREA